MALLNIQNTKVVVSSGAIRVLAVFISLLLNLYIARVLLPSDAGVFFVVLTLVTSISQFSTFGLQNSILKDIPYIHENGTLAELVKLITQKTSFSIIMSFSFFLLFFTMFWASSGLSEAIKVERGLILSALPSVIFISLNHVLSSVFQALGNISKSVFLQSVIQPLVFLFLSFFYSQTLDNLVICYVVSSIVSLVVTLYVMSAEKILPGFCFSVKKILFEMKVAFPFSVMIAISLVTNNFPIIYSNFLGETDSTALLAISLKISLLVNFILVTFNSILMPKVSLHHKSSNIVQLQKVIVSNNVVVALVGGIFCSIMFLFSETILSLFGESYKQGVDMFLVLLVGQFFNVMTGSVGAILMMSGFERKYNVALILSMIVLVISALFLGALYGVFGVAIAISISLIVQKLISLYFCYTIFNYRVFYFKV